MLLTTILRRLIFKFRDTNADQITVIQLLILYPFAIQEQPIRRARIAKPMRTLVKYNLAVKPRGRGVRQDNVSLL
jgi:hypothetical protein